MKKNMKTHGLQSAKYHQQTFRCATETIHSPPVAPPIPRRHAIANLALEPNRPGKLPS